MCLAALRWFSLERRWFDRSARFCSERRGLHASRSRWWRRCGLLSLWRRSSCCLRLFLCLLRTLDCQTLFVLLCIGDMELRFRSIHRRIVIDEIDAVEFGEFVDVRHLNALGRARERAESAVAALCNIDIETRYPQ